MNTIVRNLGMLTALSFFIGTTPLRGDILNEWLFNDGAGSNLTEVVNTGTEGRSWNNDFSDSATDGLGNFRIASTGSNFRDANISAITSGTAYLRMDVESWDLTSGVTTDGTVALGFRDVSAFTQDLALVRFLHKNDIVELQTRVGTENTKILDFPVAYSNGVGFVLEVDLETDTFNVYVSTNQGPFAQVVTNRPVVAPAGHADRIRFSSANSIGENTDFFNVDQIIQGESLTDLGLITGVELTNITVLTTTGFEFTSEAGILYTLQYDEAGGGTNWVDSAARVLGDGGTKTLFDPEGFSGTRTYRVVEP